MATPDYGLKIAEDFQEYLKSGDKNLITNYSSREIKIAISRLSPFYNNNKLWYREMEDRIKELESAEDVKRRQHLKWKANFREQWLDRVLAYALGILTGLAFTLIDLS